MRLVKRPRDGRHGGGSNPPSPPDVPEWSPWKLVLSNGYVRSRESMASRGKDFCVDRASSGAALGDLQFCGDGKIDRREAGFFVARLVTHFERQTLPAQRGAAERLHLHPHRHAALINIQLALGEFELAEGALRIGDTHQAEACRKLGADFRGHQILFRYPLPI